MKNVEDIYPLSPLQQGLLFHSINNLDSDAYFQQFSCIVSGNLQIEKFQQAWQKIVERHPVLRTAFIWEGVDKPLQVVRQKVELPWINLDWQNLSTLEQQQELENFLVQDHQQNFILEKAPLMRCSLIKLNNNSYYFVWSHHHLLLDGWCLPLIFKEVFAFYKALQQNEPLSLPTSRPYRDYIAWLQKQDLEKAKQFWQEKFRGFTAPTSFNLDSKTIASDPNLAEHTFKEYRFQLPVSLTNQLYDFSKRNHLTLNIIIQAIWGILLSRYSGESEVVFGTTVAGRPTALTGIETMIGLFINTLPVRMTITQNNLFLSWLKQLHIEQVEREEYSYTPLCEIQKWSEVSGGLPLFETLVVFENYPGDKPWQLKDSSLTISNVRVFEQSNYPLTLTIAQRHFVCCEADSFGIKPSQELSVRITYALNRFKPDSIHRLAGHLQVLLEAIVANPEQRIAELPLLTPAEQHQILVEWNNTQTDYPRDKCIHQLFEEQVEKTPLAVAVVFGEQKLTYRELNEQANQLGHYLQKKGVKPGNLVGICVERSLAMVIGFLGILKAGAAYVPIDSSYPRERLELMVTDAQISILLTQESLTQKIPSKSLNIIYLDSDQESIAAQSPENLSSSANSNSLAYVIYTSGSTGKPKGVKVPHRAVNRLVLNTNYVQLTAKDKIAQVSNASFDATTFEIWGALLNGGCIVGVVRNISLSPQDFTNFLQKKQITVLFITTALFNQIASIVPNAFASLRYLLFGGEAVDPKWVREILKSGAPENLLHVYGPTENTTFSSWYLIKEVSEGARNLPIGSPIANTQTYILDPNLNLVPIGVPGELYLGGDGLAQGYLNRPQLNQEKFISNPFSQESESHLYKTGDLARYLADGNIEFLGRLDNQVKIRGFRIELGEIEAYLSLHPSVKENVVIAREDIPNDKRLVAYIVFHQQQTVESNELRQFLKEKLPDYMIPSVFITLESLPLNPNGKVDRQALPIPDTQLDQFSSYLAPRDDLERQLTAIWEKTLGVSPIGIQDNFFDLGGHSLLGIQLFNQIKKQLNQALPIATLFQSPTIEELAQLLRQNQKQGNAITWSSLVAIQPYGKKKPLFIVPPAGTTVIKLKDLPRYLKPDQPLYGLQYLGMDGEREAFTTVEEMAAHFVQEIRTLQPQGPYYLGGKCSGGIVAYEMAQQLISQGQEVALLAMIDILSPPKLQKRTLQYYITELLILFWNLFRDGKLLLFIWQRIDMLLHKLEVKKRFQRQLDDKLAQSPDFVSAVYHIQEKARRKYITTPYPQKIFLILASSESKIGKQRQINKWQKVAAGGLEVKILPVDHDTMLDEPEVKLLAEALNAKL